MVYTDTGGTGEVLVGAELAVVAVVEEGAEVEVEEEEEEVEEEKGELAGCCSLSGVVGQWRAWVMAFCSVSVHCCISVKLLYN